MSQYFSSLPSSHLLASPLGQVLLKASREGRFSDVIYKGKSPWHKKDRGWRLHMSEEMVRGWCIPLVQLCSIHFALFRWKNYHPKHWGDTIEWCHTVITIMFNIMFSVQCSMFMFNVQLPQPLILTQYQEKERKIIDQHKIWILVTVLDSIWLSGQRLS